MRRYVLDTNVYIRAMRSAGARAELAKWQRAMAPHIHQHAVVVSELLVGASSSAVWSRWHRRLIAPAERVGRVITPDYGTWLRASRIVARLVGTGDISGGGVAPSFFNDCLLAASACREGFVLVTYNRVDFDRIRAVEPDLRVRSPFP